MSTEVTQSRIQELEELRTQSRYWRIGSVTLSVAIVAVCVVIINNAFQGLIKQGPSQEKFLTELSTGLQQDVLPRVEVLASTTVSEVQPVVQQALYDLDDDVPRVTEAVLAELETMQTSLPERGEKVLFETFGAMLESKEAQIREQFPEATEEQVEKLLGNILVQAEKQAVVANEELFAKHNDAIATIHQNMLAIQEQEQANVSGADPTWEMAILILDLFKHDLENMQYGTTDEPATTVSGVGPTTVATNNTQEATK